ncbi:MAG: efflux RND transporter periplasmic adaptor subunit [bacterium]
MQTVNKPLFFPLFLAGYLFIFFYGCKGTGGETPGNPGTRNAVTVGALVITPRVLNDQLEVTGTLLANEEIEIRSEIPGRIEEIFFQEGTPVQKGCLLLKIDDRELQAQLQKLKFEEKQAVDDLFRKKRLFEMNAVSQEEYDNSANQLGIIRSQMDLVAAQLSKTEIRAPFSGCIGLRQVSPGEYISPAVPISILLQTDPIKIEFSIPEKHHDRIQEGSRIDFRVTGEPGVFHASVYAIEPKIDPSTRTIMIRARCQNPGKKLIPGAFARVSILLETIPDALIVPTEVVIPQLTGEKVFLYKNGIARLQPVKTGIRTDREVQLIQGICPHDTVIITGLLQLRDGLPVNVKLP